MIKKKYYRKKIYFQEIKLGKNKREKGKIILHYRVTFEKNRQFKLKARRSRVHYSGKPLLLAFLLKFFSFKKSSIWWKIFGFSMKTFSWSNIALFKWTSWRDSLKFSFRYNISRREKIINLSGQFFCLRIIFLIIMLCFNSLSGHKYLWRWKNFQSEF